MHSFVSSSLFLLKRSFTNGINTKDYTVYSCIYSNLIRLLFKRVDCRSILFLPCTDAEFINVQFR
jgi:hypothetical protein